MQAAAPDGLIIKFNLPKQERFRNREKYDSPALSLLTEWSEKFKIDKVLFGETGANPVRARRREAQYCDVSLTESHSLGQAIGEALRRLIGIVPSRNIRTIQSSDENDRERRLDRGNHNRRRTRK